MEPIDPREKIDYWREHVRKVALFDGTQGEYARLNEISASKLSYYKGQFASRSPSFAKVVPKVPVAVAQPKPKADFEDSILKLKVVDPKWLATFLKEFLR